MSWSASSTSRWVLVAFLVVLLWLRVVGHYYQVMMLGVALMKGRVKVQMLLVIVDSQSTQNRITFDCYSRSIALIEECGLCTTIDLLRVELKDGSESDCTWQ